MLTRGEATPPFSPKALPACCEVPTGRSRNIGRVVNSRSLPCLTPENPMKSLIVGHGGREATLASKMAESSSLFAFMGHKNPTIARLVERSGGSFTLGNVKDPAAIAAFATSHAIDLALVSSDEPLAAGVVDALHAAGITTVGPTRAGAEIEWNKNFSRQVVAEIAPTANPRFVVLGPEDDIDAAIAGVAGGGPVVVKPLGLTAGKGVRVVGPHLADNAAAGDYVRELISSSPEHMAHVEERIDSPEFTLQAITDGTHTVFPPATYDYPYRFDGDTGPGTGGMGSFTHESGRFAFLTEAHYDEACQITSAMLALLKAQGRHFSGCVNAGFFATPSGVRVIEFNARFGDPEALNIMSLLESDWMNALRKIATGTLSSDDLTYAQKASVVTYLVAPPYPVASPDRFQFTVDEAAAEEAGVKIYFSSAIELSPGHYETLGTSRSVAVVATDDSVEKARAKVAAVINLSIRGGLEWRTDIGILPAE